jgi:hypothetical protein
MATVAHILGLILLFTACGVALCSLVLGLPGTVAIVGIALFYAWATGFALVHWSTIGWLAALAILAEAVEFLAAGSAAAATRPSRRVTAGAIAGALVGGILGTSVLFGIGSLLGALAGAFAGAAAVVALEGGTLRESITTGFAALKGRFVGFVVKVAIAVVMVIVIAAAVL